MPRLFVTQTPHDHHAPSLEFDAVCVRYGSTPALEQITFRLEAGAQVAVVGPNGAGKSVLFRIILGQEPASGLGFVAVMLQQYGALWRDDHAEVYWSVSSGSLEHESDDLINRLGVGAHKHPPSARRRIGFRKAFLEPPVVGF